MHENNYTVAAEDNGVTSHAPTPVTLEEAFKSSLAPFRHLVEKMPISLAVLCAGSVVYINPTAVALLEGDCAEDFLGHPATEFVHPMDRLRVQARMERLEAALPVNPFTDIRIVTRKNQIRTLGTISLYIPFDRTNAVLVIGTDLAKRKEADEQLRESERNFRQLFESMQDVYYRTDATGTVQMVGPAVRRVLGYEPEEIIGKTAEAFYPRAEDRDAFKEAIRQYGEVTDFSGQMVRKDGHIIDISINSRALYDATGAFAGVEGTYRDISERKNLERELRRLATTDTLTGIMNRRAFLEQATQSVKRAQRHQGELVLFILDLDYFKLINDRYGHVAGDQVLIQVVDAAAAALRDTDLFGRLGGEEFSVVLHETSREQATRVANRIATGVRSLRFHDTESGASYSVTMSIGATTFHEDDKGIERLLDRADKALYRAKEAGRDCLVWRD